MESDVDTAIRWSKRLEGLLETNFGATGRGLHEKTSSVEGQLSDATVRKLRYVATIRNKIVHEASYLRMEDRSRFERACSEVVTELDRAGKSLGVAVARPPSTLASVASKIWRTAPASGSPNATAPNRAYGRRSSKSRSVSWSIFRRDWLSPRLSAVGAVIGFVIPVLREEGKVAGVLCGFIGAVAGYYWRLTVALTLFALVAALGFWLMRANHFPGVGPSF